MRQLMSVILLALLLVLPAMAEVQNVTVKVDGLSCSLCAFGLKKSIESMEDMGIVTVDLKSGMTTVKPKPGVVLDFRRVREAVKNAGFTPKSVEVTALGRFETWQGPDGKPYPAFKVTGTGNLFVLDRETPKMRELLKVAGYQQKTFRVAGTVHEHDHAGRDQHQGGLEQHHGMKGLPPGIDLKEFHVVSDRG